MLDSSFFVESNKTWLVFKGFGSSREIQADFFGRKKNLLRISLPETGPLLVINGVISYNPYKWPYRWVPGAVTPTSKVITYNPLCNW